MKESNQRKSGAVLSYLSIIISTIIQLIYTPFLIRNLGSSEYGLYSLTNSVIGYLAVLDLGFGNAIVVYTAKYRAQGKFMDEKRLHGMFHIVFKIIGVISFLLGITLYFNVDNIFGNNMNFVELHKMKIMMLILSVNLFLSFYFAIYNSIISAYEKFTFQKVVAIVHSILKPLLMIPLLFLGFKSISLCIIITFANIFTLLSNYLYCKKVLNIDICFLGFDKKIFKSILGYSIWIFLAVIVDKVNWSVDNFVLGAVSGTIAVSVYSIASTLNQMFITMSTAISGVLLPKMSKMIAKNASNEEITNEFIKVGRIQYIIIFLMASGFTLFGKEFLTFWAGNGYEDSYYIALLLILPLCIPLIQNLGLSIMQAKNMHRFRGVLLAFISVANIFISIPLAKSYGGIGAAFGTAVSLIVGNGFIINIYYYKKVGIDIFRFWKEIIFMSIPNVLPLSLIIVFMNIVKFDGLLSLFVYGMLYTVTYSIVVYFISMNEYEKNIVNDVLIKLNIKKKV